MSERYTLAKRTSELSRLGWIDWIDTEHEPGKSIAQGQSAPVVRRTRSGVKVPGRMRWGLVPSWAEDPNVGRRLIYARSERAHSEPAFQSSFPNYRCLISVDGFFRAGKAESGA